MVGFAHGVFSRQAGTEQFGTHGWQWQDPDTQACFDHAHVRGGAQELIHFNIAYLKKVRQLQLKFSHVDVLVENLEEACRYYARVFSAKISKTLDWQRDGLHVRYAIVMFGTERLMLVQPFTGNLKALMDANGEGTIYRHCYSTPDIETAYDELIDAGVQPENENGKPLSRDNLQSPSGTRILWLPKRFGHFSIELLEEKELEAFIKDAFAEER